MVIKEMKDKILADVAAAIDDITLRAKENGIVDVKDVTIKIVAAYPLTDGAEGTVDVVSRLRILPGAEY